MAALADGPGIGPYQVRRRLGAGGMGEVFLARDTRLGRDVALKWLTGPDASAPGARERLLHEARAAATLNHPNIAGIYDIVEADDRAAIVMEYVEGETLADRLARGRLSCEEALAVAQQLADALAHAHARGIVHRDIKPANVRVTPDGRVKLLDLGLARLPPDPASRVGSGDITTSAVVESQVFAGTPAYMAPEQLLGGTVDARTDIYGFGVLLFELLGGRRPFESDIFANSVLATLSAPSPTVSEFAPGIPPDLEAIVARAMARDPSARFPSAVALLAALRGVTLPPRPTPPPIPPRRLRRPRWLTRRALLAASVVLVAAVAAALMSWLQGDSARARDDRRVIAVLPFETLGRDSGQAFLGVGVTDWLVSRLASVPTLTVATAASASEARAHARDFRKAARELDADLIVTGSIQPSNNRLLVTARIVGPGGRVSWGQTYEGAAHDLLDLQGRVVEGVANALEVSDMAQRPPPTANSDAYTDYAQGRALLERGDVPGYVEKAVDAFDRAVRKDPSFALAHAGMGDALWRRYRDTRDRTWADRARQAVEQAVRLAPDDPVVRVALARILRGTGRPADAVAELRRVVDTQPNDDGARRLLAQSLGDLGRTEEALEEFQRAIAIRPEYAGNHMALGAYLFGIARYNAAADAFHKAAALSPDSPAAFTNLGATYQLMGDVDRALEQYERALALSPDDDIALSNIGALQFAQGRFREAAATFERACRLVPHDAVSFRNLGDAYQALNERSKAREAFLRAVKLQRAQVDLNPADGAALAQLATYEAKVAMRREAQQHTLAAIEILPGNQDVLYAAAVVRALGGQAQESLAMLELAIQRGYSRERARADPDLASLRNLPRFKEIVDTSAR